MRSIRWLMLGVVVIIAGAGVVWWGSFRPPPEPLRLPGVVETQEVRLGSKIGGRVIEVLVQEGDRVSVGQLIARLDVPEFIAQKQQIEAKLAIALAEEQKAIRGPRREEIAEARAAVSAVSARLTRMHNGFREEEKDQARNDRAAAEADLTLAKQEFARIESLHRQGSASRQDYDNALALRNRMQSRWNATDSQYRLLQKGYREEEINEVVAEVARAQARLELLEAGTREEDKAISSAQVRECKAKLAEVETLLAEANIVALEPGRVEVLPVRVGTMVAPQQPIVRILRDADWWVKIYVPATELGAIRMGQTCQVRCDAYPDRSFTGEIFQIASMSEFTPRNVQSIDERRHQVFAVKVRIRDGADVFKAGMYAEVTLDRQSAEVLP